jgi:hypothetical protein
MCGTPVYSHQARAKLHGAYVHMTCVEDRMRLAAGHFDKCEYAQALPLFEQARASFEAAGDRAGVGRACNNIATCYLRMGKPDRALPLHEQARAILEAAGDRAGADRVCQNIALCYASMGQHAPAPLPRGAGAYATPAWASTPPRLSQEARGQLSEEDQDNMAEVEAAMREDWLSRQATESQQIQDEGEDFFNSLDPKS